MMVFLVFIVTFLLLKLFRKLDICLFILSIFMLCQNLTGKERTYTYMYKNLDTEDFGFG